jgi:peptide-methionine (S)-S-oxide reductase
MMYSNKIRKAVMVLAVAVVAVTGVAAQDLEQATFAGGCFWCMEKPFDHVEGVISTTSGYSGGHVVNPTYQQVTAGRSGHLEAMQVSYDPALVSYEELLYVYWRNVDPFDGSGQFCDRGHSYSPAIFYNTEEERELATRSLEQVQETLGRRVEVDIRSFDEFYSAEEYHQDYYMKNPVRYTWYRSGCGRDRRLQEIWADEAGGENPRLWLGQMN